MKVYNSTKNNIIANQGTIATSYVDRTIGLLGKRDMAGEEFLVIDPCFSIHTFFMKFAIDVLFINKHNKIIALYENVPPNKILPIHPTSEYVIELFNGTISAKNIEKKDIVSIQNS